jgi:hypothetical protein
MRSYPRRASPTSSVSIKGVSFLPPKVLGRQYCFVHEREHVGLIGQVREQPRCEARSLCA